MPATMTWRRDSLSQTVEGVPHTFSSWNNCMSKAYCKWPAIIGIIIASLLVISIIWCLARCLCCGMSCCCSCFSCCDSCCPSGSRRSNNNRDNAHKYADPQPSMFHPAPYQGYQPAPPPPSYEPPQFARFDASKKGKVNEDALPAMPSWDTASERKIPQVEPHADEDMEMARLDPLHAQQAPMLAAHNATASPRLGYAEMDSAPYRQHGAYEESDRGSPYGRQESGVAYGGAYPQRHGQWHQQQQAYGRGYGGRSGYEAYTPSESTEFEPPSAAQRSDGGVYSPASPPAGRQYADGRPPSGLQVGRKAVPNSWREV